MWDVARLAALMLSKIGCVCYITLYITHVLMLLAHGCWASGLNFACTEYFDIYILASEIKDYGSTFFLPCYSHTTLSDAMLSAHSFAFHKNSPLSTS